MIAELTEALVLDAQQQAALKTALPNRPRGTGQARPDASAATDGAGDAEARTERRARGNGRGFDGAIARALEPLLTETQKKAFEAWRAERGQTRRAQVWVLRAGTPQQIAVTLGIADDRFTELVGGLKEGDAVITRANGAGA